MKFKQVKLALAAIGAGAAVTMGVLAGSARDEQVVPGTLVSDPSATLGETVTPTTPPQAPQTSVATPLFTFTTPSGFAAPH
jgi:hypothetical protein